MLLGTEFYQEPPFTIIDDYTFDEFTSEDLKDYTSLEELSYQSGNLNFQRINKLFEKHQEKTNFITLYSNCLLNSGRVDEARTLLTTHFNNNPFDIDLRICLAKLAFVDRNIEQVESLLGDLIKATEKTDSQKFTDTQFLNFCNISVLYFLEQGDRDSALKVYSWTLKEDYEIFSKQMAVMIAGFMVMPMPEKLEELHDEESEDQDEVLDTYFHHLDLNNMPFHEPFSSYHDLYLDEITLQDIRAMESFSEKDQIAHDIRWLLRNEVTNLKNHCGVIEPASAKFAFILASTQSSIECFEDLLATLRLPFYPYFEFIFGDYFFEYILNPFYHLGLLNIEPLYKYVTEEDHSLETREEVARVLKVIAEENPALKTQIYKILDDCELSHISLPEKHEIIENKIPQLLQHFVDIPVNYHQEDDDYEIDDSTISFPDPIELPGGGIISKPISLESAMFSNYMLATMDMQREAERYEMPPNEVAAPLKPIVNLNKIGRNDPCPCGSGKKYKKCCLNNLN